MKGMMKYYAPVALLASGIANAATVDLFTDPLAGIEITSDDAQGRVGDTGYTVGTTQADQQGVFASIIGGYRDLIITQIENGCLGLSCLAGTAPSTTRDSTLTVTGGSLNWGNEPQTASNAAVQWDGGADALTPEVLDVTGLGGIDLTAGGTLGQFNYVVIESDAGFIFTLEAYTSATQWTVIQLVANPVAPGSPVNDVRPFSDFADCGFSNPSGGVLGILCGPDGAVDFTNLGALQLQLFGLDVPGNTLRVDLSLGQITTSIPEPTSLALIGAGVLAAGGAARRRAKKV